MSRLVESIKLIDGSMPDLAYHNTRINAARKLRFRIDDTIDLAGIIVVPGQCASGLYKVRVLYDELSFSVEFHPYETRVVRRIRVVEGGNVDYSFKYEDRRALNDLFALRGDADDILIMKNGYVTDTFSANTVFFDGARWVTPDTPLLAGTKRARLLEEGRIFERSIVGGDLNSFEKVSLINAMIDLDVITIPMTEVII